jgi:c(7)-type cytochrome triheme protein
MALWALLFGAVLVLAAGLLASARAQDAGQAPTLYDPANPDRARLQRPADAQVPLPLDMRGQVDWMKALRQGLIKPRSDLKGEQAMQLLELDIVMKNTAQMPHVKFPHEAHTQWLACSNCHDKIFLPKAGANAVTMARIFRGEFCGTCHGRVAFTPLFACERCHSVPHGDIKAWW